ncbi:MAG: RNA ligase family protein [Candidatus Heimdallarchaeota archaeon]
MKTYPKVHHLGDPMLTEILDGHIYVEEKIDGSQFRIRIEHGETEPLITFGSRRVDFLDMEPEKNFKLGCEEATKIIKEGHINPPEGKPINLFAEYLKSPKQNTLSYERVPKGHIMIFEFEQDGKWLDEHEQKKSWCDHVGFECIPLLWEGEGSELNQTLIEKLLQGDSALGNTVPEGIVVKNYNKFFDGNKYAWMEGQWLVGKFVRQEFQELNKKEWEGNKNSLDRLKSRYNVEARWSKAVQKLRDEDKLQHNMKDMALLIKEVLNDVEEECSEDIKEQLFDLYGRTVIKSSVKGLAEFYNKKLLEDAIDA